MWESPVNVMMGELQTQIEGEIFKAIQNVGIVVDKEELIKAMQYDRDQYDKGYKDGYADAIDDFTAKLIKHISNVPGKRIGGGNVFVIADEMKGGA
jgi:hypothetical protein